jgi:hypothetical protein
MFLGYLFFGPSVELLGPILLPSSTCRNRARRYRLTTEREKIRDYKPLCPTHPNLIMYSTSAVPLRAASSRVAFAAEISAVWRDIDGGVGSLAQLYVMDGNHRERIVP